MRNRSWMQTCLVYACLGTAYGLFSLAPVLAEEAPAAPQAPENKRTLLISLNICEGDPLGSTTAGTIKVLGAPKILTLENLPCRFVSGGEVVFQTKADARRAADQKGLEDSRAKSPQPRFSEGNPAAETNPPANLLKNETPVAPAIQSVPVEINKSTKPKTEAPPAAISQAVAQIPEPNRLVAPPAVPASPAAASPKTVEFLPVGLSVLVKPGEIAAGKVSLDLTITRSNLVENTENRILLHSETVRTKTLVSLGETLRLYGTNTPAKQTWIELTVEEPDLPPPPQP